MLVENLIRENRCQKITRGLFGCCKGLFNGILGGVVGAICGVTKPIAEWGRNAWEKVYERHPDNRGRLTVVIDMGAAAVVLFGSTVRFGTPAIWFFAATGGSLCLYGAYKGVKMGLQDLVSAWDLTKNIACQLWVWEVDYQKQIQERENIISLSLSLRSIQSPQANALSLGTKLIEGAKGAVVGTFAGALMPYAQLVKTILSAKRRWPVLINTGAINIYAGYVGTTYVGTELSLWIVCGLQTSFAVYGMVKGTYIGYHQGAAHVSELLWQGGLEYPEPEAISLPTPSPILAITPVISVAPTPMPMTSLQTVNVSDIPAAAPCLWMMHHQKNTDKTPTSVVLEARVAKQTFIIAG